MTTSKPSKPKSKVQQIASSISNTTKVSAHDRQGTKGVTEHNRKKTQAQKDSELADKLLKNTELNTMASKKLKTYQVRDKNGVDHFSRQSIRVEKDHANYWCKKLNTQNPDRCWQVIEVDYQK